MKLFSLILEIKYKNRTPLILDDKRINIYRDITGSLPENVPSNALNLTHQPKSMKILVEENRIGIISEIEPIENAKYDLVELFCKIYNQVDFQSNEINRIGLRSSWFEEWEGNFETLKNRYLELFFKNESIINESIDVSLPLTLLNNNYKVNFNTGPMRKDQAVGLLLFKEKILPDVFIYIDIDNFTTTYSGNNNIRGIKNFINESVEYGLKKSEIFTSLIINNDQLT